MKTFLSRSLTIFAVCLSYSPAIAFAAPGDGITLETFIVNFGGFLQYILLPFMYTLAVLFFLYNIARLFIIQGGSDESRTKARRNAIYGIAAFIFLFSIWALVNLTIGALTDSTNGGLGPTGAAPCPDYVTFFGGSCN